MVFPVVFAIIMAVLGAGEVLQGTNGFLGYFAAALFALLCSIFGFIIGLVFGLILGIPLKKGWTDPEMTKLIHMRDGEGLTGSFCLGTGSIQSIQYYFYYTQGENGGIRPGKIATTEDVTLYEGRENIPSVLKYTWEFKTKWHEFFAICWGNTRYEIFIPSGSIKRNFVLL